MGKTSWTQFDCFVWLTCYQGGKSVTIYFLNVYVLMLCAYVDFRSVNACRSLSRTQTSWMPSSTMSFWQAGQSSNESKSWLQEKPSMSITAMWLNASSHCTVIPILRDTLHLCLSIIMPTRMRLFVCFTICIQENGGGIHRYVALTMSTTYDTNDTLEKTQSAQPRRHHNSNHHLIRQNSSNLVPQ